VSIDRDSGYIQITTRLDHVRDVGMQLRFIQVDLSDTLTTN
jgi:hypothetical protein